MTDKSTLEYYNSHASDYANITKQADMSENYSRFLKHVKTGGSIADIGCGSGRDLKLRMSTTFSISKVRSFP